VSVAEHDDELTIGGDTSAEVLHFASARRDERPRGQTNARPVFLKLPPNTPTESAPSQLSSTLA
jgi:hypothetical protein